MAAAEISIPVKHIPEDIIFDNILPRVQVKTLLRSKCVSKSWNSFISSPGFIKTHLKFASNSDKKFVILSSFNYPRSTFIGSLSSILTGRPSVTRTEIPVSRVVGAYNGILCLVTESNTIILCNPSTKRFIRLVVRAPKELSLGFCYDKTKDDYKVVTLLGPVARVFSLRGKCWMEIDGFQGGVVGDCYDSDGICIDGVLHWSAKSIYNLPPFILSLDIVTNMFGVVELPEPESEPEEIADLHGDWKLKEFGGCLGLICDYNRVRVDIWVMRTYGVRQSWVKLVSIPYLPPSSPTHSDDGTGGDDIFDDIIVHYEDDSAEDDNDLVHDSDDVDYDDDDTGEDNNDGVHGNDVIVYYKDDSGEDDNDVFDYYEDDNDVDNYEDDSSEDDNDGVHDKDVDSGEDDNDGVHDNDVNYYDDDNGEDANDEEVDDNDVTFPNLDDVISLILKSKCGEIILNDPVVMQNNLMDGSLKYHEIYISEHSQLYIQGPPYVESLVPLTGIPLIRRQN